MNASSLEAFLAKLYTDPAALERFLSDSEKEARRAGLLESEIAALCRIDRAGLQMAAMSYARKGEHRRQRRTLYRRLTRWLIRVSFFNEG